MEPAKMKKVTIKAPEQKPEIEKAKRIYRGALDIIKAHDAIFKQKKAYRDVFLPDAIMLRDRLQEYCEKLLFCSPVEYRRKAEELLWRKAFYDIIQLMKHNRKHMIPTSNLESAFRTHLASALGYYHHLLCRLQADYDLNLEMVIDFYYVPESKTHRKPHHASKAEPVPDEKRWAVECCYRCLVYLGDLARYQHDYDGVASRVLSQRYYYQAFALCPENGMPHNQLGTLAGTSCYSLNAAYYYIRCILSPSPFEGAHGNLVRLFERNRRRYQELDQLTQHGASTEQNMSRDVKRFVVRLLELLDIFYSKTRSVDIKVVQEICQNTLHDFNLCMFTQQSDRRPTPPPSASSSASSAFRSAPADDKPSRLSDEMVFKIIVICLAMIHIMQRNENKQVAAAIAFSLALFSHILNHVIMRLQSALYDLENPQRRLLPTPSSEELAACADGEDTVETTPTAPVKRKTSTKSRRQQPQHIVRRDSAKDSSKPDDETNEKKRPKKPSKLWAARRRRRKDSDSESEAATHSGSGVSDGNSSESETEHLPNEKTLSCSSTSSSFSDSDTDALTVSQELRVGFSAAPRNGNCSPAGAREQHGSGVEDGFSEHDESYVSEGRSDVKNITRNFNNGNSDPPSSGSARSPQDESSCMSDMADYLKEIPLDWLSDAANLLSQTLHFNCLMPSKWSADVIGGDGTVAVVDDGEMSEIMRGMKQVRVPPGFEASSESQHVMELGEKLANFDIETDTDISVCPTDTENSTVTESEMDTEVETDKESVIDRTEVESKRLERVIEVAAVEGLLCSVKVYCDWMRINPHIIATCAKISSSLWYRLSVLLNFLPSEADLTRIDIFGNSLDIRRQLLDNVPMPKDTVTATEDFQCGKITVPVTEDRHLRRFPPLEAAYKDLVFDSSRNLFDLSAGQEAMVRVCCLRRFGYFITHLKSVPFTYDTMNFAFCGPQRVLAQNSAEDSQTEQKMVNNEARRNQLMRDMAQLRLQSEVSRLEGSLQSTTADNARPTVPPYVVPDAQTLCDQLPIIRKLAASSRFIIVIPLAVIDHLDVLKKDSAGSREAIRWLEAEFHKGSRYIRAQKPHEKLQPTLHINLKKDKEAMRFAQICDCCRYLGQQQQHQGGNSNMTSAGVDLRTMVCLLTTSRVNSSDISIRTKEVIAAALQQGLPMQTAQEFLARWKEATKTDKG
jgi:protein SMG5